VASSVLGLHHVTAVAGDPQQNIDFFTQVLGLRLVKVTVDFRDPETYHLVYGTGTGQPGTLLTFRCWPGAIRGRAGTGQVHSTALGVPPGSLDYWHDRLMHNNVAADDPQRQGSSLSLSFRDPDGLRLELVADEAVLSWEATGYPLGVVPGSGPIPIERSIRGLHGITIWAESGEDWKGFLGTALGLHPAEEDAHVLRYSVQGGRPGAHVVVRVMPGVGRGLTTVGYVDHTAFRVPDCALDNWRARLAEYTDIPGPAEDYLYFQVARFEGPQGIRLELASEGPGVTIDEPPAVLGTHLVLPPWLEARRPHLERRLPPLRLPGAMRSL
jgi:glyoxalase family protein